MDNSKEKFFLYKEGDEMNKMICHECREIFTGDINDLYSIGMSFKPLCKNCSPKTSKENKDE